MSDDRMKEMILSPGKVSSRASDGPGPRDGDEAEREGRALRARLKAEFDALLGPELIELLVDARKALPEDWLAWKAERGFQYLRWRLRFSQRWLGLRCGMTQSQVSRVEGGADVLLSTWRRVYEAMGFELVLLPVFRGSLEELEALAEKTRSPRAWVLSPARPRRRYWLEDAPPGAGGDDSPAAKPGPSSSAGP